MKDNSEAMAAIDVRLITLRDCERSTALTTDDKIKLRQQIDDLEKWKLRMFLEQENGE